VWAKSRVLCFAGIKPGSALFLSAPSSARLVPNLQANEQGRPGLRGNSARSQSQLRLPNLDLKEDGEKAIRLLLSLKTGTLTARRPVFVPRFAYRAPSRLEEADGTAPGENRRDQFGTLKRCAQEWGE
jgi:hypothetical protein